MLQYQRKASRCASLCSTLEMINDTQPLYLKPYHPNYIVRSIRSCIIVTGFFCLFFFLVYCVCFVFFCFFCFVFFFWGGGVLSYHFYDCDDDYNCIYHYRYNYHYISTATVQSMMCGTFTSTISRDPPPVGTGKQPPKLSQIHIHPC